jgi:hypothetical protein
MYSYTIKKNYFLEDSQLAILNYNIFNIFHLIGTVCLILNFIISKIYLLINIIPLLNENYLLITKNYMYYDNLLVNKINDIIVSFFPIEHRQKIHMLLTYAKNMNFRNKCENKKEKKENNENNEINFENLKKILEGSDKKTIEEILSICSDKKTTDNEIDNIIQEHKNNKLLDKLSTYNDYLKNHSDSDSENSNLELKKNE